MDHREHLEFVIFGAITLVLWLNQIWNELFQFCGMKSKIQYLFSIWNWFDIFGLTTVFLITTIQMSNQMSLQEYTYLKPEWFEYFGGLISV